MNSSASLLGFNGEPYDPVSSTYHLGNGYRTYSPILRQFLSPDSMSPFGAGGINPYAYCAEDPINHSDPSGHIGIFSFAIGLINFLSPIEIPTSLAPGAIAHAAFDTAINVAVDVVTDGTAQVAARMAEHGAEAGAHLAVQRTEHAAVELVGASEGVHAQAAAVRGRANSTKAKRNAAEAGLDLPSPSAPKSLPPRLPMIGSGTGGGGPFPGDINEAARAEAYGQFWTEAHETGRITLAPDGPNSPTAHWEWRSLPCGTTSIGKKTVTNKAAAAEYQRENRARKMLGFVIRLKGPGGRFRRPDIGFPDGERYGRLDADFAPLTEHPTSNFSTFREPWLASGNVFQSIEEIRKKFLQDYRGWLIKKWDSR